MQGTAKGAIRMNPPSRFEIEKFANDAFEIARHDILAEYADKLNHVAGQVRLTGNRGSYLPTLFGWGAERVREIIRARAKAYVEAFTLYRVPSDAQAEKVLRTCAREIAAGSISAIRGHLRLRSGRLRIGEEGQGRPWHLEIERAMDAALKEGVLRLRRQRIEFKGSESIPLRARLPTGAAEGGNSSLRRALEDARREKEKLEAKMNAQSLKPFPYTGLPAFINLTLDEAKPTEKLRLDWQQLTDKIAHIRRLLDGVPDAELGKELVKEPVGTTSERRGSNPSGKAAPAGTKRLRGTITSPIAARRMEDYMESKGTGATEFAGLVGTTDRTLRAFRKTGKLRRDIFDAVANAMGTTREALLKPE
jgi:hypothetical protein